MLSARAASRSAVVLGALLVSGGCGEPYPCAAACDRGEVCIDGECRILCSNHIDCRNPQLECGADGYCILCQVSTWYRDSDGDAFGDPNDSASTCRPPDTFVTDSTDCNDNDPTLNPNTAWYRDNDRDGFGHVTLLTHSCTQPSGHVDNNADCDDGDDGANTYPGAAPLDDPLACMRDDDLDDYGEATPKPNVTSGTDCDDANILFNIDAQDVCDGADNDCSGAADDAFVAGGAVTLQDSPYPPDNGKHLGQVCGVGPCLGGAVVCGADGLSLACSTADRATAEVCNVVNADDDCDGIANNGILYFGSPPGTPCNGVGECGAGLVVCTTDGRAVCSSDPEGTAPEGVQESCDDADNDCDGLTDEDFSFQGAVVGQACPAVGQCGAGMVECHDLTTARCSSTHPSGSQYAGQAELCDNLDNDCDGRTDNGYFYDASEAGEACDGVGECGAGVVECSAANVPTCSTNPDGSQSQVQSESCDGKDNDCDGVVDNVGATLGASAACPALSCAALLAGRPGAGDGVYWLDPPGAGAPFQAYCDMTTDGGGWTLCFAYDNSAYDSATWPTAAAGRNKLLAQQWGETQLSGSGTRQGSFCSALTVVAGTTQLRAEVVRVDTDAVLTQGTYLLGKSDFFTQVHDGGATDAAFDCLVDTSGQRRLLYANYALPNAPKRTNSNLALVACDGTGQPGAHLSLQVAQVGFYGMDSFLVIAADVQSGPDPDLDVAYDQHLSLYVNWYADVGSGDLWDGTSVNERTQTKFGINVDWLHDAYGRSGDSPGPYQCHTQCGHTDVANNMLKQRLWLR